MDDQAADVYRVEADWERVSWLGVIGRLALAAISASGDGPKAVVRIIDKRTSAVVMVHKWESMVATETEYNDIKIRLQTMTVREFEEAYSLSTGNSD